MLHATLLIVQVIAATLGHQVLASVKPGFELQLDEVIRVADSLDLFGVLVGEAPVSQRHKRDEPQDGRRPTQEPDYYDSDTLASSSSTANNQQAHDPLFDPPLIVGPHQRLPEKEYLSHHLASKACRLDRGCQRKDKLNNTYLNYCTRYKLESLFSTEILMSIMHDSSEECERILDEFIQLDELINQFNQFFKNLLTRYNCHNGYSVKWSCEDCKVNILVH